MEKVETGKVKLIVRIPDLSQGNALLIARDVRITLEECARLKLLDEFSEVVKVEYAEVPVKEAN